VNAMASLSDARVPLSIKCNALEPFAFFNIGAYNCIGEGIDKGGTNS
jgi:hypothetical protein